LVKSFGLLSIGRILVLEMSLGEKAHHCGEELGSDWQEQVNAEAKKQFSHF